MTSHNDNDERNTPKGFFGSLVREGEKFGWTWESIFFVGGLLVTYGLKWPLGKLKRYRWFRRPVATFLLQAFNLCHLYVWLAGRGAHSIRLIRLDTLISEVGVQSTARFFIGSMQSWVDIPYLFQGWQPNKVLAKLLGTVVMKVTISHKQSLIFRLKFPTYPSPTPTVYEGIPEFLSNWGRGVGDACLANYAPKAHAAKIRPRPARFERWRSVAWTTGRWLG